MKKSQLFLTVLLIICFSFSISACNRGEQDGQAEFDDRSVHEKIGDEWKERVKTEDKVIVECYGEFGDVHVVILKHDLVPGEEGEETVDGVEFRYNYAGYPLRVWKDHEFYSLQEAFDAGILTHENLVTVRDNHIAEHVFMYK